MTPAYFIFFPIASKISEKPELYAYRDPKQLQISNTYLDTVAKGISQTSA